MAMTIDGLVSGLNTSEMVSQLMQVEALPQTALKKKVTVQNNAVTAYQNVNAKLAALTTAAKALGTTDTWGAMKATSSSDAAIVTAKAGASAGSITFTVDKVAAAHTVTYKDMTVSSLTDAVTSPVIGGTTFAVLLADGTSPQVTPADGSLQSVVNAINETPNAAYRAAAVQLSPGQYTLQLTATATGGTTPFTTANLPPAGINLGAASVTVGGSNAELTFGTIGSGGYKVSSASNTFADVLSGVTVAVTKTSATPVTVSMVGDQESVAGKVQALVDAANAALKEIKTQTAVKNGTTPAGALAGDSTMRALSQEILGAISAGSGTAGGSLSAVGISLDRAGVLSFDKVKFLDTYAANPAGAKDYFDSYTNVAHAQAKANAFDPGWDTATGLARKLETIGLNATAGLSLPTDAVGAAREGIVAGMITRRTDSIRQLTEQVASWDTRLTTRRSALQRQYSALEVAMSKMQQQSSWLSGQLAGL